MGALRTGSLLVLAGLILGAAFTDWADSPTASNAFLDDGWVRSLVDGWGWLYLLAALLIYAGRLRLALRYRQAPSSYTRTVPIELVGVAILAGFTALVLSWISVQLIPCILQSRC